MGVVFERNGKTYISEGGKVSPYSGGVVWDTPTAAPTSKDHALEQTVDALQGMGWRGAYSAGDALRALGAESLGKSITDRSLRGMEENQYSPDASFGAKVGDVFGQGLGSLGVGLAATAVGGPIAGLAAGFGSALAQSYAGMRAQQEQAGETARGRAFVSSVPSAAIEFIAGPEKFAYQLAKMVGKEGLEQTGKKGLEAIAGMEAKDLVIAGAKQGAWENVEEMLQMPFEQYGGRGSAGLETQALIDGAKDVAANAPAVFLGAGLLGGGMSTYQRSQARGQLDSLKALKESMLQEEANKQREAEVQRNESILAQYAAQQPETPIPPDVAAGGLSPLQQAMGASGITSTGITPTNSWEVMKAALTSTPVERVSEVQRWIDEFNAKNGTQTIPATPAPSVEAGTQEIPGWEDQLKAEQQAAGPTIKFDDAGQQLLNLGGGAMNPFGYDYNRMIDTTLPAQPLIDPNYDPEKHARVDPPRATDPGRKQRPLPMEYEIPQRPQSEPINTQMKSQLVEQLAAKKRSEEDAAYAQVAEQDAKRAKELELKQFKDAFQRAGGPKNLGNEKLASLLQIYNESAMTPQAAYEAVQRVKGGVATHRAMETLLQEEHGDRAKAPTFTLQPSGEVAQEQEQQVVEPTAEERKIFSNRYKDVKRASQQFGKLRPEVREQSSLTQAPDGRYVIRYAPDAVAPEQQTLDLQQGAQNDVTQPVPESNATQDAQRGAGTQSAQDAEVAQGPANAQNAQSTQDEVTPNAVQVETAGEVPVQPKAKRGKRVRQKDTVDQAPAEEGKKPFGSKIEAVAPATTNAVLEGESTPESDVPELTIKYDGIDGREVSPDRVPNGNDAFQYAVGRVEEDGPEGVYRRRADERGSYGGWDWENDVSKLAPESAAPSQLSTLLNTPTFGLPVSARVVKGRAESGESKVEQPKLNKASKPAAKKFWDTKMRGVGEDLDPSVPEFDKLSDYHKEVVADIVGRDDADLFEDLEDVLTVHRTNERVDASSALVAKKDLDDDVETASKLSSAETGASIDQLTPEQLDSVMVPYRVWDEETNSWQETEVSALKALKDIEQDEKGLQSYINCLKGK